ncbi:MAG: nucleoside kinase [Treponema sp.]|nr:nucleoside kinase [Treponema sp.]
MQPKDFLDKIAEAENISIENIAAVRVNNEICSLSYSLDYTATIQAVPASSNEGADIYRRTLCFVLAASAHTLFPGKRLIVGHSLGHGYYYTLDDEKPITLFEVSQLKAQMHLLIEKNLEITQLVVSYAEALKILEDLNLEQTRKSLDFNCPSKVIMNNLTGFSNIYYSPLLHRTGRLSAFDLTLYEDGFLLRFPPSETPGKLDSDTENPKLFSVYKRYKDWGKRIGVTSAAELNYFIKNRTFRDFINITETLQNKCFAEAADTIQKKENVKVVLIAGPSSSGKTTSSKKLAQQLQVNGFSPRIISIDDYYVGRESTPKDENGNYDYECLEALDIALLNENLVLLFNGGEINLPTYDFVAGERRYSGKKMRLEKSDILILEGIHALNDKLTPLIDTSLKFKIYVSALTQLNLDDLTRISTSDNRLIRRIVRDSQFRGKSAADTIDMWPSVKRGERLHIFPFQNNADIMINTALDYELAVLRVYAEPLLRCVTPLQEEYSEATRLLRFLTHFSPIPSNFVPSQSLLREFIGGSEFKY